MTSKSLYFKLMREDFKRRIWAVSLTFLSMFFAMPMAAAMRIANLSQMYERWLENGTGQVGVTAEMLRQERLFGMVSELLGFENIAVAFLIGTAAVVLGLTGFLFLHSKKEVDFYHSIPVRREVMFAVKYADGFLIIFTMYLVNMLFAAGIFAANGVSLGLFFSGSLITMAVHMTGFLLIYSVMVIAVLLTGNFFISVIGGAVLYGYVPTFLMLIQGLMSMFFVTMDDRNLPLDRWALKSSPVSYYGYMVATGAGREMIKGLPVTGAQTAAILNNTGGGYEAVLKDAGIGFIAALILTATALFLYRRRPSESAGKAMAFRITMAPVKILLVVPVTILMAIFFWNIYYSIFWAAVGFLLGLLLTHGIIEIIYHFEFRKLFANPAHMAVCAVLALAVIGVFRYDLVGYDRYIPDENEFVSASVSCGSLDDWHDYGLPEWVRSGYSWRYMNQDGYAAEHMAITDYAAIRAIAENGVEKARTAKEDRLHNRDGEKEDGFWGYMEMGYQLKNGKKVYRNYRVNITQVRDVMEAVYKTEEYKKGIYPIMNLEADNITGIYAARGYEIKPVEADSAMQAEILSAYKEELCGLTLSERETEVPVTTLRFLTKAEREYLVAVTKNRYMTEANTFRPEVMEQVNFFPVYPSFTKTISLLKDTGADVESEIPIEDVERIEVAHDYGKSDRNNGETTPEYVVDTVETEKYGESQKVIVIENDGTPENEEKIRKLLSMSVYEDMSDRNRLRSYECGFTIRVYRRSVNAGKRPSEEEWSTRVFKGLEIPDFLNEELRYDQIAGKNINYGIGGEK